MTFTIQKANFWKRFSAWLIDTVLVLLLSVALSIPTLEILKLNSYSQQLGAIQLSYRTDIEAQYSVKLDISEEYYNALTKAEKDNYDAASKALNDLLAADETFMKLRADRFNVIVIDVCVTVALGIALTHLVIPLFLKNGQTLGKKTFGLCVIRTNGVKITHAQLFVRSIVGIFAIETAAVAFLLMVIPVGTIAAVLVQALQIGVMIKTDTNSSIHDLLADTAVVDFASQKIFETEEECAEFIARMEAEQAEAQNNA